MDGGDCALGRDSRIGRPLDHWAPQDHNRFAQTEAKTAHQLLYAVRQIEYARTAMPPYGSSYERQSGGLTRMPFTNNPARLINWTRVQQMKTLRHRCRIPIVLAVTFLASQIAVAQLENASASPSTRTLAALPDWAYPVNPPLGDFDAKLYRHVPGSTRTFTRAQVENDFTPPDWHPEDHPPMPTVVSGGRRPGVLACMKCHLSNGAGHPESAELTGLPVAYIRQQMLDFRDGGRKGARALSMLRISKEVTDSEVLAAANYFSALPAIPVGWRTIVETETVPMSHVGIGGMRFADPIAGTERIGKRIIELPQNPELAELRDSRAGFFAYAPKGSIARGEALVTTGGGKTLACGVCHGPDLKGLGEVPRIVSRSPLYVFRQLNDIQNGSRASEDVVLMRAVVAELTQDDMIAIAAYLTSKGPG
jgi:cytochrome c553